MKTLTSNSNTTQTTALTDQLKVLIDRLNIFTNIVKPWSKSESKPLSQQTYKLNKSLQKKILKKDLDLGLTPPPITLQLLSMKECSGNKHCKILVSFSDKESCIQALGTARKLMELHASLLNCMQGHGTAYKLM